MLLLQLIIFSALFLGFGIFSAFRKKGILAVVFILLGGMLLTIALMAINLYPEQWPY